MNTTTVSAYSYLIPRALVVSIIFTLSRQMQKLTLTQAHTATKKRQDLNQCSLASYSIVSTTVPCCIPIK